MNVRAKFRCTSIEHTENGPIIRMMPVTGGSAENEQFFKWTPTGELKMGVVNPDAAAQFEVGKTFYVDFTKTE